MFISGRDFLSSLLFTSPFQYCLELQVISLIASPARAFNHPTLLMPWNQKDLVPGWKHLFHDFCSAQPPTSAEAPWETAYMSVVWSCNADSL